ncbi:hypothetical protein [Streptomyces sp. NPDC088915]|uniref:hypothetical protein n=1 Tax=Streptomyces sp. NPDC088915 TaxID=3365912 RepID=UPI0037F9BDA2
MIRFRDPGVAVLSTPAAARTESLAGAGRSAAEALTGGHHLAFGVGTGLLLAALAVAALVLRTPARGRPEARTKSLGAPEASPAA